MIERKITSQRMYRIPKDCLDHFFVFMQFENDSSVYYEAEWIFDEKNYYAVVVNSFGNHSESKQIKFDSIVHKYGKNQ